MAVTHKQMKWVLRIIFWGLALFFIIRWFAPLIVANGVDIDLTENQKKDKRDIAEKEYLQLFGVEAKRNLQLWDAQISAYNHPILTFSYRKSYDVIVQEINQSSESTLMNFVSIEKLQIGASSGVLYKGYETTNFILNYAQTQDSITEHLYLAYNDNTFTKSVLGDSVLVYSFATSSLSYRNQQQGANDVVIVSRRINVFNDPKPLLALAVMLYKKGQSVFVITVIPRQGVKRVDKEIIPELLGIYP